MKIALAFAAVAALAMAQDKAGDKKPQKVAKDQNEANLINGIAKEPDGNKRLASLDQWTKGYPDTQFSDERDEIYLATYQQLKRPREAFDKAKAILKKHPDNFMALSTIIAYVPYLNNGNPAQADLDTADAASKHVMNDADEVFAEKNKPGNQSDDQWAKMKPMMMPLAQKTVAYVHFQKKDMTGAEPELIKTLQGDPSQASASYMLAQVWFGQRQSDPKKQPPAFFEFARAAVYDGPNSLDPGLRQSIRSTVTKYYTQYHGSAEGLDKLMTLAKTSALPPDGFTIESTADIEIAKAKAQAADEAAHPMMTMWKTIKTGLTGDNPDQFFEGSVKDAALPGGANGVTKFRGKLISTKPAIRPKELTIAVENPDVADCVLKLAEGEALPGKMDPGGEIEFEGTAKAYQKAPYTLTLEVTKDQITGWTGKNVPVRRPAAKKKAQ